MGYGYAVIIEKGPNSYGLPKSQTCRGALREAETRDEVYDPSWKPSNFTSRLSKEDGLAVPEPQSYELVQAGPSGPSVGQQRRCHGQSLESYSQYGEAPPSLIPLADT